MPLKESDISVEVIEIYPNQYLRLPNKFKEQGTCHITLKICTISMELKNIRYQIRKNETIWVGLPMNAYPDQSKPNNKKVTVPSISFEDPLVFEMIKKAIVKDLQFVNYFPLKE